MVRVKKLSPGGGRPVVFLRCMAADLDHRSPDVSQWGVRSSVDSTGGGVFNTSPGAVGRGGSGNNRAGVRCGRRSAASPAGCSTAGAAAAAAAAAVSGVLTGGDSSGRAATGVGVGVGTEEAWAPRTGVAGERAVGESESPGGTGRRHLVHQLKRQQQQLHQEPPGYRDRQPLQQEQQQHQRLQQLQREGERQGQGREPESSGERRQRRARPDAMETELPEVPYGGGAVAGGSADAVGVSSRPGAAPVVGGLEERGETEGGGGSRLDEANASPGGAGVRVRGGRPASERLSHKLSVSLIDTYKLINQR